MKSSFVPGCGGSAAGCTREPACCAVDAQKLLDWRYYVAEFPWTSLGLAAAIGFWLTPGPRVMPTVRLADDAMDEVAKRTAAQAPPPRPRATAGWLQPLGGMVANLAIKSALGYLSGRMAAVASPPRPATSERPRHDSYR